jgi:hypothetical protein
LRPTAPIGPRSGPMLHPAVSAPGRAAVSDNHWRLRRHIGSSRLAPRPVGRGPLGLGRGAIAAGWWSWHLGLISRDASRVQWVGRAVRFREPKWVAPEVRPISAVSAAA